MQSGTISATLQSSFNEMSESDPPPQKKSRRRRGRRKSSTSPDSSADNESSGDQEKPKRPPGPVAPTKAETALFPPFSGVSPDEIYVPKTKAECWEAADQIFEAGVGGFDTEAKPTFRAGQKCDGPHVVQFSLTNKAFIFQLQHNECERAVSDLIASHEVLKVGFGLNNDHKQIRNRLGISLNHVLDLDQVFKKMGYRGQIGVRGAIGVLLKQGFKKSKSTTTSNWALRELSPKQLLYAANDAYAALKIMEILQAEGHLER
ncbi:3'-5' exonuclease domain-containing protein 2 [bacterium]|nr:3'-5' exonuclease domain-containing protein 2 [bacterium]